MSLKPIEPRHYASNDVDLGAGGHITNQARSMNHYGTQHKRPEGVGMSPASTGGMRAYAPHGAPQKDKRKTVMVVAIIVVVLIALAVGIGFGVSSCSSQIDDGNQNQQPVTLTIPSGYGAGDIAQLLYDNHVIASTTTFMQTAQQHSATGSLKAGTYTFESGSSYEDIVNALVAGPEVSGVTLTVPEGFTVSQVAQRVAATFPTISYDEFMAQAKASNYVGEFTFLNGAYNDSLEGFLFPKTYTFDQNPTSDTIIRAMLRQFSVETASIDWSAAAYGGVALSQYQAICMASLVERETAQDFERPLVASVMYNRLNAGMFLQIDASIAYALNKSDLLTWADLEVDSEYNLYTHYGLTPGPICSPSLESILAVLNTEQTGYYYYVASDALDGTHVFCETYEQFETALQAYNLAAGISG